MNGTPPLDLPRSIALPDALDRAVYSRLERIQQRSLPRGIRPNQERQWFALQVHAAQAAKVLDVHIAELWHGAQSITSEDCWRADDLGPTEAASPAPAHEKSSPRVREAVVQGQRSVASGSATARWLATLRRVVAQRRADQSPSMEILRPAQSEQPQALHTLSRQKLRGSGELSKVLQGPPMSNQGTPQSARPPEPVIDSAATTAPRDCKWASASLQLLQQFKEEWCCGSTERARLTLAGGALWPRVIGLTGKWTSFAASLPEPPLFHDSEQPLAAIVHPGVQGDAIERGADIMQVQSFGPCQARLALRVGGAAANAGE